MNSNLPPDFRGPRETVPAELKCHKCLTKWEAQMFYEDRAFQLYDEDQAFCPNCGHEDTDEMTCSVC